MSPFLGAGRAARDVPDTELDAAARRKEPKEVSRQSHTTTGTSTHVCPCVGQKLAFLTRRLWFTVAPSKPKRITSSCQAYE